MIFCKVDKSISIFPYEKAVGHRLFLAPALKELTNMTAMLDFVLISSLKKKLAMEIYSGSEKKVSTS